MATLLAEIYGPDAETRRAGGRRRSRRRSARCPSSSTSTIPTAQPRAAAARDDLDRRRSSSSRSRRATSSTRIAILSGGTTVGYSHRGDGRQPIPIRIERPKGDRTLDERFLTTPIPANVLPGDRGVVELGDVVRRRPRSSASFPVFRHNGRAAEMVTAELAGDFEAPLYGMLAVQRRRSTPRTGPGCRSPSISLHGQPEDESTPTLLWDGEWEVTWVTFRDMGAAFVVALLGIYILVVAQFGSFKVPLVILTPIPLTFIGILGGHWLFGAPFSATSMIGFIALAGIIVRNSILLVDFIRHADTRRTGR